VGIGLLVAGGGKKGEADELRAGLLKSGNAVCGPTASNADCAKFTTAAGAYATFTNAGGALLIGAGVLGITTAIYAIATRRRPQDAGAPKVGIMVGPAGAALAVGGNF